jgi:hypothetical protein
MLKMALFVTLLFCTETVTAQLRVTVQLIDHVGHAMVAGTTHHAIHYHCIPQEHKSHMKEVLLPRPQMASPRQGVPPVKTLVSDKN